MRERPHLSQVKNHYLLCDPQLQGGQCIHKPIRVQVLDKLLVQPASTETPKTLRPEKKKTRTRQRDAEMRKNYLSVHFCWLSNN